MNDDSVAVCLRSPRPIHALSAVYAAIHAAAPAARIIVGLYPQLFPPLQTGFDGSKPDCWAGDFNAAVPRSKGVLRLNLHLVYSFDNVVWLNKLGDELNDIITHQVNVAKARDRTIKITTANATKTFNGHQINCGSGDGGPSHWFGRAELTQVGPHPQTDPNDVYTAPSSFHPTIDGQKLGFEAAFRTALG